MGLKALKSVTHYQRSYFYWRDTNYKMKLGASRVVCDRKHRASIVEVK